MFNWLFKRRRPGQTFAFASLRTCALLRKKIQEKWRLDFLEFILMDLSLYMSKNQTFWTGLLKFLLKYRLGLSSCPVGAKIQILSRFQINVTEYPVLSFIYAKY